MSTSSSNVSAWIGSPKGLASRSPAARDRSRSIAAWSSLASAPTSVFRWASRTRARSSLSESTRSAGSAAITASTSGRARSLALRRVLVPTVRRVYASMAPGSAANIGNPGRAESAESNHGSRGPRGRGFVLAETPCCFRGPDPLGSSDSSRPAHPARRVPHDCSRTPGGVGTPTPPDQPTCVVELKAHGVMRRGLLVCWTLSTGHHQTVQKMAAPSFSSIRPDTGESFRIGIVAEVGPARVTGRVSIEVEACPRRGPRNMRTAC